MYSSDLLILRNILNIKGVILKKNGTWGVCANPPEGGSCGKPQGVEMSEEYQL